MIIWIASYPKSGNTWVRLILNSLIYNHEVNINDLKISQFPNRKHFDGLTDNVDNIHNFFTNCELAQTKLNLGPDNMWRKYSDYNLQLDIENEFEKEMKELKYI